MVITYMGGESFKVQFGDIVIAYNPASKESGVKSTSFGADIALISLNHPDFNGKESTSRGEKQSFVISGPGEYEIKGIFVKGYPSESIYGSVKDEKKINTIYTVSLENINLCFLGALSEPKIKDEVIEALDEIDVLFVPIGGDGVLTPADAYKIAVQLEPKIIIPMHYEGIGDKGALKTFLKEGGEENATTVDKFTLKKKDLEGKEGDIVVCSIS